MNSVRIHPLEKPVVKDVTMPGSKSYTNRALLLAALTKNPVTIKNPLFSDDTMAMIGCLQELGIKVEVKDNCIHVLGSIIDINNATHALNAKLSGTTIRFMLALSILLPGRTILDGDEGLQKRPIADLVDGLQQLGAKITYTRVSNHPPLAVEPSKFISHEILLKGDVSSQFTSAMLMIAPLVGGLTIKIIGNQISKPYIDMTIESMKQFGINVVNNNYKSYDVPKGEYMQKEYVVEGDYSSAGYFFAIAALTKSTITVYNLNPKSAQADQKFLEILEQMGNQITYGKDFVTVKGNGVSSLAVAMESYPDQVQTLAILAAFAKGTTKISGVRSLRVKETERVMALQNELQKMGIQTDATENTLAIYGENPSSTYINTYGDHRMAMAFAVAGTKLAGMHIENPSVVRKTFPDFWDTLTSLGITVEEVK